MGRGKSKIGYLSAKQKLEWINDLKTHTKEENDRAERNLQRGFDREKKVIDTGYKTYMQMKYIKDENDPWWQDHVKTYNQLKETINFVKKQRKKLKK